MVLTIEVFYLHGFTLPSMLVWVLAQQTSAELSFSFTVILVRVQ